MIDEMKTSRFIQLLLIIPVITFLPVTYLSAQSLALRPSSPEPGRADNSTYKENQKSIRKTSTSTNRNHSRIPGYYSDGITHLHLRPDSSFYLIAPDPVFPYTYHTYSTEGRWIVEND